MVLAPRPPQRLRPAIISRFRGDSVGQQLSTLEGVSLLRLHDYSSLTLDGDQRDFVALRFYGPPE